jgi:glycerophosphoryl diester phosphodiesterase
MNHARVTGSKPDSSSRAAHALLAILRLACAMPAEAFDLQGHRGDGFLRRAALALLTALLLFCTVPAQAFDLQGHRGARGLAPENTLPAFARALDIGVTTLELDLGVTRDGVVVVHHDLHLNPDIARGPDGRWLQAPTPAIHALSFHDLQRYDVGRIRPGSDYSRRFPNQKRMDRVRIPALAAVFDLARHAAHANVRFNVETKISPLAPGETPPPDEFARAVIAAVRAAGMQDRVTIQSFDWRTLAVVQREAPEIGRVYLSAQQEWLDNIGAGQSRGSPWTAGLQHSDHGSVPAMVKAAGGRVWSPHYGDLTPELLGEAKSLGMKVIVWTVNTRADMDRYIDWGVDGIITDYPDLLRDALEARRMPLPPVPGA